MKKLQVILAVFALCVTTYLLIYNERSYRFFRSLPKLNTKLHVAADICTNGPKQNFMFLKTHKTGSSTVQNALVRYANRHDIFVGLPATDIFFNYNSGSPFNRRFMKPLPPNRQLNALMHHMRFNYNEVNAIMPPDSIYVTILRDPATQFESVFKYLRNDVASFKKVQSSKPFVEYITNPEKYFNANGPYWWFGKNNVFFDFGYQNTNENDDYIEGAIAEIDRIFDLIMISDYFDISMLLLKDLMCWSFEDILYLTMNARSKSTVEKVEESQAEKIRLWNKADNGIFQYFNSSFWKRVEEYGKERMETDLKTLADMNEKLKSNCFEENLILNSQVTNKKFKMFNPAGIKIDQHRLRKEAVNNETCSDLILPEFQWVGKLRRKQYGNTVHPTW